MTNMFQLYQPLVAPPLTPIARKIEEKYGISLATWITTETLRAQNVAMYRKYYEGDHPANITKQMRELLRATRPGTEFCDNYMPIIITTEADRLTLLAVESDDDSCSEWCEEVLQNNRIDGLQSDVHEAVLRDGDSYVMISYDAGLASPRFTHELAFDGLSGVLMVYESTDSARVLAAVKIWHAASVGSDSTIQSVRVNIYYPDSVEKYLMDGNTDMREKDKELSLTPFQDATDTSWPIPLNQAGVSAKPLGVPMIHFRNRGRYNYGQSEIRDAITLQDALNRTFYSMVMAGELSAFQIRVARGFQPPAEVTPGSWVVISGESPLRNDENADVSVLPVGDLSQFINEANWIIDQISRITRTPAPEFQAAANISGEALKQREIGLLGKVKRAQVRFGNAWEDCMRMAYLFAVTYGTTQPPTCEQFYARWSDPEIRNDQVTVQNALAIKDSVDLRTFLRAVAEVFGWDESQIDTIVESKMNEDMDRLTSMAAQLPRFGNGAQDNQQGDQTGQSGNQNDATTADQAATPTTPNLPNGKKIQEK